MTRYRHSKKDMVYLPNLEIREQNGYTAHEVPVYTLSENGREETIVVPAVSLSRNERQRTSRLKGFTCQATIWIGRLDNPAFGGSIRVFLCRDTH